MTVLETQILLPTETDTGITLSEEEFNFRPRDKLREMCVSWHKKVIIELLVTDFRVNPIYVSVGGNMF